MDHLMWSTDQSLDDKIILGHQDLPPCAQEPWWPTPGWPWPRPLVDHRLMVMSWGCICFWLLCWAMMLQYARRWYFYLEHLIRILSIAGAIEVVRVYFLPLLAVFSSLLSFGKLSNPQKILSWSESPPHPSWPVYSLHLLQPLFPNS